MPRNRDLGLTLKALIIYNKAIFLGLLIVLKQTLALQK